MKPAITGKNRSFLIVMLVSFLFGFTGERSDSRVADRPRSQGIGSGSVFEPGEELIYNVSFASFDLGRIRIKQVEKTIKEGRILYRFIAYIDSYKGVPFVNLHAIYESLTHTDGYSVWFQARDKEDENWIATIYEFDYGANVLYISRGVWNSDKITRRDTIRLDTLCQDGLSLFFLARNHAHKKNRMDIPVLIGEKKGSTHINFTGEGTKMNIDAVDYPVDVVYFEGEADFVGVFGLTGGFEGWFSNDSACVPILAKMKVLIGNVRIELLSWKRTGWNPPRFGGNKN